MDGFAACFEGLDDPRKGNAGRHDLLEMLMIALCTVLSGGEDCTDMAVYLCCGDGPLKARPTNGLHRYDNTAFSRRASTHRFAKSGA